MWCHNRMQAGVSRSEALFLRVVFAANVAHELAHDVSMVVGRSKRVFGHHPSRREYDKIADCGSNQKKKKT